MDNDVYGGFDSFERKMDEAIGGLGFEEGTADVKSGCLPPRFEVDDFGTIWQSIRPKPMPRPFSPSFWSMQWLHPPGLLVIQSTRTKSLPPPSGAVSFFSNPFYFRPPHWISSSFFRSKRILALMSPKSHPLFQSTDLQWQSTTLAKKSRSTICRNKRGKTTKCNFAISFQNDRRFSGHPKSRTNLSLS